jgi:nucleotide-binding universal stress UspA family protein
VVRKPELPRRASPSREDQALVEALTERNHSEASLYLEELRARLSPPADVHILIEEHVAATLQHLAVQENVDLVLLSAHGYSGETRWPYGSLATSFMMYGNKPLLIVQDLPRHAFEPTAAELAAREHGRH